jgi:tetratricopeptide (TPR) repeat protein
MRYHCVQCDQEFDVPEGEDKPRCPKCLRQHGLRPIEAAPRAKAPAKSARATGLVAVAVLVAAGAGGFWYWQRTASRSAAAGAAVDAGDLREQARKTAGIDVADAADVFHADAAVEAFAKRATSGKSSADDKAQAIVAAIQARAKSQAFVPWSLLEPRDTPAQTAAQTLQAIAKDGARRELYPLEVAALGVAALRSEGVPAQLAEVGGVSSDRAPFDPSGRLGYYAVAVPSAAATAPPHVYDAYGGRPQLPAADVVALTDPQAVGVMLSLRAMQRLVAGADPAGALQLADASTKLAPSSAAARGVRGAVLLATGGKDEGARELEAASQLRPGPAQQNNLAMYSLATGDADRAAKLVAQALSAAPEYASAHLTLASVHLGRAERDLARGELTQAERIDPKLPALPMAWAELYAASGDLMQAQMKAEEGVRLRPKSPETHLLLARVHRQSGHYDAMRSEARKVLELAPASQKDQISQVLRAVLGPTALETDDSAEPGDTSAAAPSSASSDTKALDAPAPDPGSLQLGAREPKLRLGGDSKLKLDLTH